MKWNKSNSFTCKSTKEDIINEEGKDRCKGKNKLSIDTERAPPIRAKNASGILSLHNINSNKNGSANGKIFVNIYARPKENQ